MNKITIAKNSVVYCTTKNDVTVAVRMYLGTEAWSDDGLTECTITVHYHETKDNSACECDYSPTGYCSWTMLDQFGPFVRRAYRDSVLYENDQCMADAINSIFFRLEQGCDDE